MNKLEATRTTRAECPLPIGEPGYEELQSFLEAFGDRLLRGNMSRFELRYWECKAFDLLEDGELDMFMRSPNRNENFTIAEKRWKNTRAILLARMDSESGHDGAGVSGR